MKQWILTTVIYACIQLLKCKNRWRAAGLHSAPVCIIIMHEFFTSPLLHSGGNLCFENYCECKEIPHKPSPLWARSEKTKLLT